MQAKHGSAVSFRSRGRLIGIAVALVALAATMFAPTANAAEPPPIKTYLALGDSLAFGYSQQKFEENFPNDAPAYFEENYANGYAKKVRASKTENNKGLVVVNNGCPGETSGGLIGSEPPTCSYQKAGLPLHNGYAGHSQLESALSVLTSGGKGPPAHPVRDVSLNIGSNDELAAVGKCKKEVTEEFIKEGKSKYGPTPESAVSGCLGAHAPELFGKILHNIGTIIVAMHNTAGYTGPIILLGFYNPDAILLKGSNALQTALNTEITKTLIPSLEAGCYGKIETKAECEEVLKGEKAGEPSIKTVKFANPFPVFNPGPEETPKEEKAICKYTEMCNAADIAANNKKQKEKGEPETNEGDIHPTKAGYEALAKIMFSVSP
jgi:lysophospholipase L1-like esterase